VRSHEPAGNKAQHDAVHAAVAGLWAAKPHTIREEPPSRTDLRCPSTSPAPGRGFAVTPRTPGGSPAPPALAGPPQTPLPHPSGPCSPRGPHPCAEGTWICLKAAVSEKQSGEEHVSPCCKLGSALGNMEQTPWKAITAGEEQRAGNTSPFCSGKGAGVRSCSSRPRGSLQLRCSPGDPEPPMAKASSQHDPWPALPAAWGPQCSAATHPSLRPSHPGRRCWLWAPGQVASSCPADWRDDAGSAARGSWGGSCKLCSVFPVVLSQDKAQEHSVLKGKGLQVGLTPLAGLAWLQGNVVRPRAVIQL